MNIQKVKDARQKGVVAFSRYCQEKRRYSNNLFCFFEGEDAKYYCPRIEKYTGYSFERITVYNCGGKKGVLAAYRLIMQNGTKDSVAKAFFIDSDYDTTQYTNYQLYQTPCYSIENMYTSINVFKKIINREFGINTYEKDFEKCCEDYANRKREFHDNTVFINAWLSCQRFEESHDEDHKVVLSKFKISKLFSEISIQKVALKETINIDKLKELFPNCVEIELGALQERIIILNERNRGQFFRGKFEIEFLKKIIDSLISKNKDGDYFSQKYTSVNINPNINSLSALSEYADTPQCLISFLAQYNIA
jgi:hypothetical protein